MDKSLEPLFTPWKIGNVEIKNRIVLCPMGGTSLFGWMEPHHLDKDACDFFMDLAKNNVGLIIPGIAPLKNLIGGQWLYKSKSTFKKLKGYMDEIHKTGAKVFVQLTAGFGRSFSIPNSLAPFIKNKFMSTLLKPIINLPYLCASPSPLPSRWLKGYQCRQLSKKEIKQMIKAFAKTSLLCKQAGVDGVEIHAVHEGYLLDQFTLNYTNKRTDEYGGSFENRYRFATEVVKAIKEECGQDYPVSLRYSAVSKTKDFCEGILPGEDYQEIGRDIEEGKKAAKYLQDAGYDMLNTDNGTYDAWYWAHPPLYMPKNCNLQDVEKIKQVVSIPVVCAGKMEVKDAVQAIEEGKIDAMGVARQFLTDPHWVTKMIEGREKDIRPCIYCHNACLTMAHYEGVANDQPMQDSKHMSRCALNPMMMDGGKYDLEPAKKKKNIAVIGGGVGGMEFARVATLRGHKVTIYEKSSLLGGVFISACKMSFKERDRMFLDWLIRQIEKLNIEVKFNTEIKDLNSIKADEIVVATGSTAKKLNIKGFDKAIEAIDYLEDHSKVGEKVAIIGGGLTGCEIAYQLALDGKKPFIIEAKNDLIATRGVCLANSSFLRDYFKHNNVPIYLESMTTEIGDNYCIVKDKNRNAQKLDCDSVIVSVGYNSNPLACAKKKVHIIGDAYKVGNLRTVIWRAWDIAKKI